jgi:hypothetical protein
MRDVSLRWHRNFNVSCRGWNATRTHAQAVFGVCAAQGVTPAARRGPGIVCGASHRRMQVLTPSQAGDDAVCHQVAAKRAGSAEKPGKFFRSRLNL